MTFCCERPVALFFAGIFTLFQSCIGVILSSLAIALYFCEPLMPVFTKDIYQQTTKDVWLKFIYVYFYDKKTIDYCYMKRNGTNGLVQGSLQAPGLYQLSQNVITSPELTDKYFMGYLAANAIWMIVSVIHITGSRKRRPSLFIPWILVTVAMCLFDVALLGIYCLDLAFTVGNLINTSNSADWSLFTVSLLLPLYFSRGAFIGWALNVSFSVLSMLEAGCCGGKPKNPRQTTLPQEMAGRHQEPLVRGQPDLIPTLDRQSLGDHKPLQPLPPGNSNLYRASDAGLPQLNHYPPQPQQRTTSLHPQTLPDFDPRKNHVSLPIVVPMTSSPRLKRVETPPNERRYLPRASLEPSGTIPNRISTKGMVEMKPSLLPPQERQEKRASLTSQQGEEFRYQRPWSYLRPNQPFNRPYESHPVAPLAEEQTVSPYGKIYLSQNDVDLLKDMRFEYTRQDTHESHYDRPVSQRSTLTEYESSESYESAPFLDRRKSAHYASCPVIDAYSKPNRKVSKSEQVLNEPIREKKKVQFSNYFLNHNSGKTHEYSQVPGVSSENVYEAVNYGVAKSRGNSQLCMDEFVVKNWFVNSPERTKLSVTDLDQPSPEKIFKCRGKSHVPPCNGNICKMLCTNTESVA